MFLDVLFSLFKKIIMNKPMYQVINNLPIDYDFQSKTKEELKLYAKWFEENKESRLQELIKAVKTTKGYENWEADYSPESLKMLGKWFGGECRNREAFRGRIQRKESCCAR